MGVRVERVHSLPASVLYTNASCVKSLRVPFCQDVYRGGRKLTTVQPERNLHSNVQGAVTEVALRSNLKEDLYVVLASLEADGLAAFQVLINPMVIWLWIGGFVLILGTLVSAWPSRRWGRQK